ncbi:MAG TPA: heavy-metal-associated domain-containing protein [Jiangellaceae bacterium]|nr:heavy-metal-associated domain-containing protein [Jiangellaceae bacterium]
MSTTTIYTVSGMHCDHCVAAVTEEISKLPGVAAVDVDLVVGGESTVAVSGIGPVAEGDVRDAVDEAGYELTGVLG